MLSIEFRWLRGMVRVGMIPAQQGEAAKARLFLCKTIIIRSYKKSSCAVITAGVGDFQNINDLTAASCKLIAQQDPAAFLGVCTPGMRLELLQDCGVNDNALICAHPVAPQNLS